MRKNRKVGKRMSVVAATTMRFGAILMVFFVMVVINQLASSRCTLLNKATGDLKRELERLEDSCQRESTRWEKLKTPENIERALIRHGLSMKTPRPDQCVSMMANGQPRPGQLALTRAKMRNGLATAMVTPSVRSVGTSVRGGGSGRAPIRRNMKKR